MRRGEESNKGVHGRWLYTIWLSAEGIDLGRPYWILHPVSCHTPEAVTTVFKCYATDPYSEPRVNSFHTPFPLFFFYEIFFFFDIIVLSPLSLPNIQDIFIFSLTPLPSVWSYKMLVWRQHFSGGLRQCSEREACSSGLSNILHRNKLMVMDDALYSRTVVRVAC